MTGVELLRLRICEQITGRPTIDLPHGDMGFHRVNVLPEPGHPYGRKGLTIATAWQQLAGKGTIGERAAGAVLLDSDVMIDPQHITQLETQAARWPDQIHTAPVRLWPASNRLDKEWRWGHLTDRTRFPGLAGQDDHGDTNPAYRFSFCFTYLPRALIERCIQAGLKGWAYPVCDMNVHARAAQWGYTVRLVRDCWPVHLNY